ncbi:MAG: aldose 1-epimerase family protein [Bacteroidia bacterium]|jgi:galactose mutarotase-like enzyme|nr:aldose 1-epimerase family protein [Bacteroidia bacterium]
MINRFRIHNEFLDVRIHRKGAELCSVKNTDQFEFIWQSGPVWQRHAPNLFPIVGSLLDHEYSYNSKIIQLTHHGFARDLDFDILHQSEHSICFILQQNQDTYQSYPFNFTLLITYTLNENTLEQAFRVINKDTKMMPVSFGGHPAFNVKAIDEYEIQFEYNEDVQANTLEGPYISDSKVDVIKGNKIPLNYLTFDRDALVFQDLKSDWVKLVHKSSTHAVKVDISDFPYLGIWSKPGAPFVCIEPWQGVADLVSHNKDISEKEGIILLETGKEIIKSFTMEFSS